MAKKPIILTDEIAPPPALVRAGLDVLPAIVRAQGEPCGRKAWSCEVIRDCDSLRVLQRSAIF